MHMTPLRMTGLRTIGIGLAGVAFILVGCDNSEDSGDDTASTVTATGSAAPDSTMGPTVDSRPPAAIASIDGEPHDLALGTYCWGGLCADAIGIIAPPEPVAVSAGASLDLAGDITGIELTESSWVIYPVTGEPIGSGENWVAFRPEGDGIEVPVGDGTVIPGDLEAGEYLLTLTARQEGQDAFYGLQISVD